MHSAQMAEKYGLTSTYEGIIPVRICNINSDEINCTYKIFFRGSTQQMMRDMIANMQELLEVAIEQGVD